MRKHLGAAYLGGSGSGPLIRLWLRCWPGLWSSVGLTILGGSLLRRPTQHAWQVDKRTLVVKSCQLVGKRTLCLAIQISPKDYLTTWGISSHSSCSSQRKWLKEKKQKLQSWACISGGENHWGSALKRATTTMYLYFRTTDKLFCVPPINWTAKSKALETYSQATLFPFTALWLRLMLLNQHFAFLIALSLPDSPC